MPQKLANAIDQGFFAYAERELMVEHLLAQHCHYSAWAPEGRQPECQCCPSPHPALLTPHLACMLYSCLVRCKQKARGPKCIPALQGVASISCCVLGALG